MTVIMPFLKKPKTSIPLHTLSSRKSIKNGVHNYIFNSRSSKYKGDWKNDKKNGKGIILMNTGQLYEGDWCEGFRQGFGIQSKQLKDGTFWLEYRGEWQKEKPNGVGWWYYENGDIYFGFWQKGYRHGYGKMWYQDGTLYVGYWKKNFKEGIGMFVQVNGNRYEGNWAGDVKNGLGRFYHLRTGQLQEGCWVNDICIKSKMTDVIREFVNFPTEYPIRPIELEDARKVLEESELWLGLRIDKFDKKLQFCVDKI